MATENTPQVDPATPGADGATPVDPAPASTSAPVDPAASPQTTNAPVGDDALRRQIADLEAKLSSVTRESIERRQKIGQLKSIEEQHAEAVATNEELTARVHELEQKLEGYTSIETSERERLLGEMTEEDRKIFGSMGLGELRVVHQRFYSQKPASTSQGDGKPPVDDKEIPLEEQAEAALAAGDTKKFNEIYDRIKNGGR